jgi:aryl-alcohol dehydrogenase-like predicted oxidoreductase
MGKVALQAGIHHIDTAQGYNNESQTGEVIASGIIPREKMYITSKCEPIPLFFYCIDGWLTRDHFSIPGGWCDRQGTCQG